jgi:hypothetical protein
LRALETAACDGLAVCIHPVPPPLVAPSSRQVRNVWPSRKKPLSSVAPVARALDSAA